jgi:hypothetical protein
LQKYRNLDQKNRRCFPKYLYSNVY